MAMNLFYMPLRENDPGHRKFNVGDPYIKVIIKSVTEVVR